MFLLSYVYRRINKIINSRELSKINCRIKENVIINGKIKIYGTGVLYIGAFTKINSGEKYNPIGGQNKTIISLRNNGQVIIGSYVGISNSTIVSQNKIEIQDNVKIGGSCKIYDNDFHSLNYILRTSDNDTDIKSAPILIKEGAFIGSHSIILKGVTIGKHSIVGAGSVVAKDIPDGEIWAGNPARLIRKIDICSQ